MLRRRRSFVRFVTLLCAGLTLAVLFGTGCATRPRDDRIINRYGLNVYLRSDRKLFGKPLDRGYAQPSDIPVERLRVILGSLEIERRERARTVLEPAIPAEILNPVSAGVAEAFREATPADRIVVMAERKQMQKKIFDRKFLTTFVTWMEGDELIVHLSRADWPIDEKRKGELPRPHANNPQQKFRLVTNEFVHASGKTGVAIDWKSDVFGSFAKASELRGAPVSAAASGGAAASGAVAGAGEKTVLMEAEPEKPPASAPLTSAQLEGLDADDLRWLADLEESRVAGEITEEQYQRRRDAILEAASSD